MGKKNNTKALIFIFTLMVLAAVIENTFGIFVPVFKSEFGIDDNSISNMFIVGSASYMFFTYIGGVMCEKIGQKKVYILGMIVAILAMICLWQANSFYMVILGVALANGGVALNAIASNTIIPIIVITAQTIIMNIMHFFYAMGASLGQAAFGELSKIGVQWRTIYLGVAVIYVIIMIVFIFFKMPSVHKEHDNKEKIKLTTLFKNPTVILYMFGLGLYAFAEQGTGGWFTNYITSSFGIEAGQAAMYTAIFFGVFAFGRLVGGFVVQKTGYFNTMAVSLILGAITFTIGILMGRDGLIVISFSAIFFSINFPTGVLTISKVFKERSSYITGIIITSVSFVIMMMNKIMGIVSDKIGAEKAFYLMPICLLMSAILMIILYNRTRDILVNKK
ncbi:sugar MFS transporter [uncultured Clostridium sp.]|uniref:MFS transporter n=1 Tax=uncultured Clostridium sp. TaxID=59620 RepID=UPI00261F7309|nr:MFS transporter [uncultured Clostridium sp.]